MKLRLTVEHDFDGEYCDPRNGDGSWKFVTWHQDYDTGNAEEYGMEVDGRTLTPSIGLRRKLKVGTAFMLDCYERSGIAWSLHGEGYYCPWDSSSYIGMLIWTEPLSHLGAKTYAEREEDARGFLNAFNDWANGQMFGYTLERIEECEGCHGEVVEHLDSCWGFIGGKYMAEELARVCAEYGATEENTEVAGDAADIVNHYDIFPPVAKAA